MEEERSKLQKTLLIVIPIVIIIFLILYIYQSTQKGILIYDSFLKEHTQENQKVFSGQIYEETAKIIVEKKNDDTSIISINIGNKYNKEYQVEFKNTDDYDYDKEITIFEKGNDIFEGYYSKSDFFPLYQEDGSTYMKNAITVIAVNGKCNWNNFDISLREIADIAYGYTDHKGQWEYFIVSTLFMLLLLLDIRYPLFLFKLKHILSVQDPEPSDIYIFFQQASWYVMPIIFIILYIIGLVKIA